MCIAGGSPLNLLLWLNLIPVELKFSFCVTNSVEMIVPGYNKRQRKHHVEETGMKSSIAEAINLEMQPVAVVSPE